MCGRGYRGDSGEGAGKSGAVWKEDGGDEGSEPLVLVCKENGRGAYGYLRRAMSPSLSTTSSVLGQGRLDG